MISTFKVKNYKSFYDEAIFEMDTTDVKDENALNYFEVADTCLLKSSFIYGKNAGGKSNFFKAVKKMKEIVIESFKDEKKLEVSSFTFNEKGMREPSEFEVEFYTEYKGQFQKFRYGFKLFDGKVQSEWLYRKLKRESYVFLREASGSVKINTGFNRELKKFEEFAREDSLFLSVVNKLNDTSICKKVHDFFQNILIIDSNYPSLEAIIAFEKDLELKKSILHFIRNFDQDIEGINVEAVNLPEGFESNGDLKKSFGQNIWIRNGQEIMTLLSSHKKFTDDDAYELIDVNFEEFESDGTKKLFAISTPIVYALTYGKTVFFDELDSKLHPLIVKKIISLFNSIDSNRNNAQFICNTHNPLILDDDTLMKDQFWFVNKNIRAESELYRLSDFTDLRSRYLSKRYLLGQFDAIPKV